MSKEWNIKEFAHLTGYKPAYVRQCCNQYKNSRGNIARLPEGYGCHKIGRDWFIHELNNNTDNDTSDFHRELPENCNDNIEKLLNDALKLHPNPVEWLSSQLAESPWICRSDPREEIISFQSQPWFFDMLQESFRQAVLGAGEIKLELKFKPNGDWDVTLLKAPNWIALTDIRREGMMSTVELQLIASWFDEIESVRRGGRRARSAPFKEISPTSEDYKVFRSLCLDCCKRREKSRTRFFCDDLCQDRHSKWIAHAATNNRTKQSIYAAAIKRLSKERQEHIKHAMAKTRKR